VLSKSIGETDAGMKIQMACWLIVPGHGCWFLWRNKTNDLLSVGSEKRRLEFTDSATSLSPSWLAARSMTNRQSDRRCEYLLTTGFRCDLLAST
jgi:hypothetical protein